MLKKHFVDITLIIDRSGSMQTMEKALLNGSNEFIEQQKKTAKETGNETFITLVTFDDKVEIIFDQNYILDTRKITQSDIFPRGITRLIDTAVEQLNYQNERVSAKLLEGEYNSSKKIFALLTDGMDNMSTKYTEKDLNLLITSARDNGTLCIFLGANQDAIISGNAYGFTANHSMEYGANNDDATSAMRCMSNEISREVSGNTSTGFTNLQRNSSINFSKKTKY